MMTTLSSILRITLTTLFKLFNLNQTMNKILNAMKFAFLNHSLADICVFTDNQKLELIKSEAFTGLPAFYASDSDRIWNMRLNKLSPDKLLKLDQILNGCISNNGKLFMDTHKYVIVCNMASGGKYMVKERDQAFVEGYGDPKRQLELEQELMMSILERNAFSILGYLSECEKRKITPGRSTYGRAIGKLQKALSSFATMRATPAKELIRELEAESVSAPERDE